jgi:hypothetical protein
LAATATILGNMLPSFLPIIPEVSAWYSGIGFAAILLLLALAAYAFRTSLGGRPMFQARLPEE